LGYQQRDYEIIDYELFPLPGFQVRFRGPAPEALTPGEYFTCLGAAQTFGCFCEKPYPALLGDRLGLPALNLGVGGAGPRLFVERKRFLDRVNDGKLAVVQVMSGRSEDNSRFRTGGLEYLRRRSDGERMGAELAYRELLASEDTETVQTIVAETRANWVQSFSKLLEAIEVPTILFWFSKRPPDYQERFSDVGKLFGEFPQLVNRAMVDQIVGLADEYVECITSRGSPQPLFSRFTGEPVTVTYRCDQTQGFNSYYPSPEMHIDAADSLTAVCRTFASSTD
jgi:uncharacterized protein DUF6473